MKSAFFPAKFLLWFALALLAVMFLADHSEARFGLFARIRARRQAFFSASCQSAAPATTTAPNCPTCPSVPFQTVPLPKK